MPAQRMQVYGTEKEAGLPNGRLLYLPEHPDPGIAARFRSAYSQEALRWDFTRAAPEKMKDQIEEVLYGLIHTIQDDRMLMKRLISLRRFYDFCVQEGIEDLEKLELDQADACIAGLKNRYQKIMMHQLINLCRKILFLQGEEIHWDAHVWYLERIHIRPERINEANPVRSLSFLEVSHKKNRELLKQYLRYGIGITDISISVLQVELFHVRNFLAVLEQPEDEDVRIVSGEQVEGYFRKLQEKKTLAEVYNRKVMSILHFFRFLQARRLIERIPFCADHFLKKEVKVHHDRSVAPEVTEEILKKLHRFPEELRLMYLHLWGTGLRVSEVCALKGDAYYIQGEDAWLRVYQIKMRSYKCIPIPDALYQLMQVYLKKYGITADDYVFQNLQGGACHSLTFNWRMRQCIQENNIQDGEYQFQCHDYRHTLATYFYDVGVPLQSIRDYLGHDYEEMTEQYIDYIPKKIEKANEEYFSQHSLAGAFRKEMEDGS